MQCMHVNCGRKLLEVDYSHVWAAYMYQLYMYMYMSIFTLSLLPLHSSSKLH